MRQFPQFLTCDSALASEPILPSASQSVQQEAQEKSRQALLKEASVIGLRHGDQWPVPLRGDRGLDLLQPSAIRFWFMKVDEIFKKIDSAEMRYKAALEKLEGNINQGSIDGIIREVTAAHEEILAALKMYSEAVK